MAPCHQITQLTQQVNCSHQKCGGSTAVACHCVAPHDAGAGADRVGDVTKMCCHAGPLGWFITDVEYAVAANPGVCGAQVVQLLVDEIQRQLQVSSSGCQ
jgi:hypothetical protein